MSSSPTRSPDFDKVAPRYDELRPAGEAWQRLVELLVRKADLQGRRVLDLGCGTGRLSTALAERYGCKVWGVDPSPRMLDVARSRVPADVGVRSGRAEDLPFKDGWFERVVMMLVLHLVDRPRAYSEVRRVLQPGGIFGLVTFDYAHFENYLLNRWFPSLEELDKVRFPSAKELEIELAEAGFEEACLVPATEHETVDRGTILKRIRGRHISTLQLLDDEEYRSGLERAERELPDTVDQTLYWLVAVARRP